MKEKKQSFDFPIGKSKNLILLSGTEQIWQYTPDRNNDVIVNINVTEIFPKEKE